MLIETVQDGWNLSAKYTQTLKLRIRRLTRRQMDEAATVAARGI